MKILITGGAGMVGSHTAEYYALKGDDVIVFDNLMRSKLFGYSKKSVEYNWNYLKRYNKVKRILGDVRNAQDLENAMSEDIDVIIHTAGQPGVGFSIERPEEDYSINAFGTFNVLEHTRSICPHATFIYCSTNKVYGEHVSDLPLRESDKRYNFRDIKAIDEDFRIDMTSHTPYGVSKYVGDIYAQEFGHSYGIKTGIFRMSCTYGTRQFGFEDQGWLAHFIISNIKKKPVTIYGNGKQVRDVLYVEDLIRAFNLFIRSDLKTEVFNIGGGQNNTLSLLECLEMIASETGHPVDLNFSEWRPSDQKVYISNIKKINKLLGWEPQVSVKKGIGYIIDWVRSNKVFFK